MLLCNNSNNARTYYWDTLLTQFKHRLRTSYRGAIKQYLYTDQPYKEIPYCDTNVQLLGFFQSSKYFSKHRDVIMNIFKFPENIEQTIIEKYGNILTDNAVFVHARRGDYTLKPGFHTNIPLSYYEEARNIMKDTVGLPLFIITSDDKDYWSNTDIFKNDSVVYFNESDIITFYMMTRMKHCVMANSTFSWWGVYVSSSTNVIAPSNWFGPEGPQNYHDIYESHWKILNLKLN